MLTELRDVMPPAAAAGAEVVAAASPASSLSAREREVLELLARGLTTARSVRGW
jgi:DNA-binding CsgD family transcriptional regulator